MPPKFGQTVGEIRANSGWNSGKQWVKFWQSKKKKSARESYKLTPLECGWWRHTGNVQGGVLVNPFGMLMMTSHRQCPRGVCLWMSKSRGVFQILGGWMTSRGQCPRGGGGACGYLCKISGKSTPLPPPPPTKAFPYAYGHIWYNQYELLILILLWGTPYMPHILSMNFLLGISYWAILFHFPMHWTADPVPLNGPALTYYKYEGC